MTKTRRKREKNRKLSLLIAPTTYVSLRWTAVSVNNKENNGQAMKVKGIRS